MAETTIENPELFFCLAGPIGVDLDNITQAISKTLATFGYKTESIRLTDILPYLDTDLSKTFASLTFCGSTL